MIKRIVFDFDGTIADTSELCLRCFHDAWEPHVGHKMTDEEIQKQQMELLTVVSM